MAVSPQAGPLVFQDSLPSPTEDLFNGKVAYWYNHRWWKVDRQVSGQLTVYQWARANIGNAYGVPASGVAYDATTHTINITSANVDISALARVYFVAPDVPDADAREAIGISVNSEARQALTYQDGGDVQGRDLDNAAIYKVTRGLVGGYFVDDNEPLDRRLGIIYTRSAVVELDAAGLQGLATQRRQILPAPPSGQYYVVPRLTIVKSGGPASPALDNHVSLWLATIPATGDLLTETDLDPTPPPFLHWEHLATQGFSGVVGHLRPGDYATPQSLIPGPGGISPTYSVDGMWTGQPLTLAGYAATKTTAPMQTPAERWAASTANLGNISLKLVVDYELREL